MNTEIESLRKKEIKEAEWSIFEMELLLQAKLAMKQLNTIIFDIKDISEKMAVDYPPDYKPELNNNYLQMKKLSVLNNDYWFVLRRYRAIKETYLKYFEL